MTLKESFQKSAVKGTIAFLFCVAALGGHEIGLWFMRGLR